LSNAAVAVDLLREREQEIGEDSGCRGVV